MVAYSSAVELALPRSTAAAGVNATAARAAAEDAARVAARLLSLTALPTAPPDSFR
jgi:hypothetical protein